MSQAISRAITAPTPHEQDRAIRWVAVWGLIGGIRSDTVRLRSPEVLQPCQPQSGIAPQDLDRAEHGQVPAGLMQSAMAGTEAAQSA